MLRDRIFELAAFLRRNEGRATESTLTRNVSLVHDLQRVSWEAMHLAQHVLETLEPHEAAHLDKLGVVGWPTDCPNQTMHRVEAEGRAAADAMSRGESFAGDPQHRRN